MFTNVSELCYTVAMTEKLSSLKLSKTMSFALRHNPGAFQLTLTPEGWVDLGELAAAFSKHFSVQVSVADILDVVEADTKQRFIVEDTSIRAAQGHSVQVDLGLVAVQPPVLLFHGTVAEAVQPILREGLKPGKRMFVHLSQLVETATAVGARRGEPVLLQVHAVAAFKSGVEFFKSENNVWLTAHVPAEFISEI